MAKRIIIRKRAGEKTKVVNTKSSNTQTKKPNDLMSLYKNKMAQYKRISSGTIKAGKQNIGKEAITIKSLENQDILQDAIVRLLNLQDKKTIDNPEHLLNKTIKQCRIDHWKRGRKAGETEKVSRFVEFSSTIAETEANKLLSTDEINQYKETVDYIKDHLTKEQKKLFTLYFMEGRTVREISEQMKVDKMHVNRQLNKIKNEVHQLRVSELYNHDFIISYGDTKTTKYPVFIPERIHQDPGRHIDIESYKPQERLTQSTNDIEYADALDIAIPLKDTGPGLGVGAEVHV